MTDYQLATEAERAVISAMMHGGAELASQYLTPEDFCSPRHARLYDHLLELWGADEPTDPVALIKRLADRGELTKPETATYLHGIDELGTSPLQVGFYAGIVLEAAEQRDQAVTAAKLARAAEISDPETRRAQFAGILAKAATGRLETTQASRRVNLAPFLDGTYSPPPPSVGGDRDDNHQLLYPGRWHTLIAPTAAGKSWFGIWHVVAELRRGNTVAYAHFEELSPAGTLDRIRAIAPDLAIEDLEKRFIWLDCSMRWKGAAEFAATLPMGNLVVLDGIVAACSQHGWIADKPEAVGEYRALFVTPAVKTGAAVISLGHPVKAKDRQTERHGFGASAWLDEVDGAAFRLEASRSPIRRGRHGWSTLFSVKDRYGQVEINGRQDSRRDGWYYLGAFTVDSSASLDNTTAHLTAPSSAEDTTVAPDGSMPVVLMAAMSAELAKQDHPLSQNAVIGLVPGKTPAKRAALEFLVNGEYVAQTKRGNTLLHRHHKPFNLDSEEGDE